MGHEQSLAIREGIGEQPIKLVRAVAEQSIKQVCPLQKKMHHMLVCDANGPEYLDSRSHVAIGGIDRKAFERPHFIERAIAFLGKRGCCEGKL